MTAVTYYPQQPQGAWPPPYPPPFPPRQPSGGTAITGAVLALLLMAYTAWPIILLMDPLIGSCGDNCFTGAIAVGLIALPLAALLLLVGSIMIFVRTVAGPVMTALGAVLVLAYMVMLLVLSHGHVGLVLIAGLVLSLPTLLLSLLPPTFAWTRAKKQAFPPPYPRY